MEAQAIWPQDDNGNPVAVCTKMECVFDDDGKTLKERMSELDVFHISTIGSETDIDNIIKSGIYFCSNCAGSYPSTSTEYGYLVNLVKEDDSNYRKQYYSGRDEYYTHTRYMVDGVWSMWAQV